MPLHTTTHGSSAIMYSLFLYAPTYISTPHCLLHLFIYHNNLYYLSPPPVISVSLLVSCRHIPAEVTEGGRRKSKQTKVTKQGEQ